MSDFPTEELTQKIKAAKDNLRPLDTTSKWSGPIQPIKILTDIISGVAVGAILGYSVDAWLNTIPLFTFIMLIFGGVCGIYIAQQDIRKQDLIKNNKEKNDA